VALIGVVGAAVAASVVDLAGNSRTRPFTRRAFAVVVLLEAGVDVAMLSEVVWTLIQVVP
jgi:hypothetical protein